MSATKTATSHAQMTSDKTGSVKSFVLLDSSGRVVGAFAPGEYRPAKPGDEAVVTMGVAAGPGQSVIEVEALGDLTGLDAQELLARLAAEPSVQQAIASTTTAGQGSLGSAQSLTAVPSSLSATAAGQGSLGSSAQTLTAVPSSLSTMAAGQGSLGSAQTLTAVPASSSSQHVSAGTSAGQGSGPLAPSFSTLGTGASAAVTAGLG